MFFGPHLGYKEILFSDAVSCALSNEQHQMANWRPQRSSPRRCENQIEAPELFSAAEECETAEGQELQDELQKEDHHDEDVQCLDPKPEPKPWGGWWGD